MDNEHKEIVTAPQDFLTVKVTGKCETKIDGNFEHVFVSVGNDEGKGFSMYGAINASGAFLFHTLEDIVTELAERGIEQRMIDGVIAGITFAIDRGLKRATENEQKKSAGGTVQ